MTSHLRGFLAVALLVLAGGGPSRLVAQSGMSHLDALASWIAMDSATGYEGRTSPALAAALGWSADQWGNVVTTVGSGSPHHVIACALDRPSYAVSQIRDDGYLRLHRIGRGSRHPLWDQQFEAQQVRVLTATGPVAGVIARSNGHFAQQHRRETAVVTADDLWLDVGAESEADVEALGIARSNGHFAQQHRRELERNLPRTRSFRPGGLPRRPFGPLGLTETPAGQAIAALCAPPGCGALGRIDLVAFARPPHIPPQ